MPSTLDNQLIIAISSRALFDFEEENQLFESGDTKAYMRLQLERLNTPAKPGVAFSLVKKLLSFNELNQHNDLNNLQNNNQQNNNENNPQNNIKNVEVVMLSRNDPVSGMRVFRSAQTAGISIGRGVFTQGRDPFAYLRPLGAHLFLSANANDVKQALQLGFPAARVLTESAKASQNNPHELKIAFDGDSVLFSDEAEQIFQTQGLDAFQQHERNNALRALPEGPFKPFLEALHRLQQTQFNHSPMRIRTALVTARSAPAHERAIRTLVGWNIAVDEAMFLGGLDKSGFLREFEPDFFFDDQTGHVKAAALHVPSGHVSNGVINAN